MSKKSQRELAEKKHEEEEQRRSRFLGALQRHLDRFGELLPRPTSMEPLTENGIAGYEVALRHLSPDALERACDEALKVCTFFPKPAEILKAYTDWLDIQPMPGTASRYKEPPATDAQRREARKFMDECFAQIANAGEPMKGQRWDRFNGWLPRGESLRLEIIRDAQEPRFHVVGKRIAPRREPGED